MALELGNVGTASAFPVFKSSSYFTITSCVLLDSQWACLKSSPGNLSKPCVSSWRAFPSQTHCAQEALRGEQVIAPQPLLQLSLFQMVRSEVSRADAGDQSWLLELFQSWLARACSSWHTVRRLWVRKLWVWVRCLRCTRIL